MPCCTHKSEVKAWARHTEGSFCTLLSHRRDACLTYSGGEKVNLTAHRFMTKHTKKRQVQFPRDHHVHAYSGGTVLPTQMMRPAVQIAGWHGCTSGSGT